MNGDSKRIKYETNYFSELGLKAILTALNSVKRRFFVRFGIRQFGNVC